MGHTGAEWRGELLPGSDKVFLMVALTLCGCLWVRHMKVSLGGQLWMGFTLQELLPGAQPHGGTMISQTCRAMFTFEQ